MTEDSEEIFVWGDDFDAILAILEEHEASDHHFTSVIKETQTQEIVCNKCGKKYRKRGGYERHTLAKHSQDSRGVATPFSNSLLEGTVAIAVRNINAAGVFAENLRKELSSINYDMSDQRSTQPIASERVSQNAGLESINFRIENCSSHPMISHNKKRSRFL
ncbi:hypothetical protein P5673_019906 [Acropora cervicornis]|uniref:C2H2-type domain-containing protein n=1 Tax=Acropora cervicornis TaxID=6130 RepID=A0AAD9QBP9_ACRCE|nr:hypothetical protein P5673_019906 [Acropora cervicornis]